MPQWPVVNISLSELVPIELDVDTNEVFRSTVFEFEYRTLYDHAAAKGLPWAGWLAMQCMAGFQKDCTEQPIFAGYDIGGGVVRAHLLASIDMDYRMLYPRIEELISYWGMDDCTADIRPLAYWSGKDRRLLRLYPLGMSATSDAEVSHIDHGIADAYFTAPIDRDQAKWMQEHPADYGDHEFLPEEIQGILELPKFRVKYYRAFANVTS